MVKIAQRFLPFSVFVELTLNENHYSAFRVSSELQRFVSLPVVGTQTNQENV